MPTSSRLRHALTAFAAAAIVFLLLDAAWLTTMASRLYRPALGHLMQDGFDLLPAALFYAIYLVGIVVFVVQPSSSGRAALARGAFFGLVCYATYDLTNQATLRDWPWHVTAIDLLWGASVTAVTGWAAHRAARRWQR